MVACFDVFANPWVWSVAGGMDAAPPSTCFLIQATADMQLSSVLCWAAIIATTVHAAVPIVLPSKEPLRNQFDYALERRKLQAAERKRSACLQFHAWSALFLAEQMEFDSGVALSPDEVTVSHYLDFLFRAEGTRLQRLGMFTPVCDSFF